MEDNRIEEGEPFLEIIREAGMMRTLEYIQFESEDEKE